MWFTTHGPATLVDDGTGVQLDFQLMYLDLVRSVLERVSYTTVLGLRWTRWVTYVGTGLCLRDLRQVNPVVSLPVTQAIFVSVRLAVPTSSLVELLELLDRMRPVYFNIDANPAV